MKSTTSLRLLFSACLALGHFQSHAQDSVAQRTIYKHFLSFGIGPSFSTGKHSGSRIEQKASGLEYEEFVPTGYGQGLSLDFAYTYFLNKELGLEVNVSRLFGTAFKYQNIYHVEGENDELYKVQSQESFHAYLWKFGFSFVGRFNYAKVSPYFKIGPIVSTGNKLKRETNETYTEVSTGYKERGEYEVVNTGGTSIGFQSTLGLDIPIFDKEFLFIEVGYTGLAHDFKKYEITKANYNGQNVLPYMSADEKTGVYSDVISSSGDDELTFRAPMSSISVMVGLKMALGK